MRSVISLNMNNLQLHFSVGIFDLESYWYMDAFFE